MGVSGVVCVVVEAQEGRFGKPRRGGGGGRGREWSLGSWGTREEGERTERRGTGKGRVV